MDEDRDYEPTECDMAMVDEAEAHEMMDELIAIDDGDDRTA